MMLSRVDLPEPDGPTTARYSPSADGQVDVVQHREGGRSGAVGAGHLPELSTLLTSDEVMG